MIMSASSVPWTADGSGAGLEVKIAELGVLGHEPVDRDGLALYLRAPERDLVGGGVDRVDLPRHFHGRALVDLERHRQDEAALGVATGRTRLGDTATLDDERPVLEGRRRHPGQPV